MNTNHVPAHGVRSARARGAFRAGLLASACLGAVALAGGAAQAFAGVAVADDGARALANPGHRTVFDDSFDVHQYGEARAASARNQAEAESIACSAESPCRSIALSFQIVTVAGEHVHLNAVNLGNAQNVHCDGCETLAGAYQFVVSTPEPFTLGPSTLRRLGRIHAELNALSSSSASVTQLKADADALAAQVTAILTAAAAAGHSGVRPQTQSAQQPVTMHRMFDQG